MLRIDTSNGVRELSQAELALVANTIRMLSADGVEKANSGHPGMPMGMADLAAVLWLKYLHFNPADPKWLNRDRFVLSNGHGCMLLYSLLHLSGYKVTLDDLKSFRQWESITPGHPEFHETPGVEATTGPLGQGISNAVGMALAKKLLSTRFKNAPINHRTFVFTGDGCMMEGVSGEASSFGGHLGLDGLIVIYDDNHISIAGPTDLAFSEDVTKRYEAYGWHTQRIDGHNYEQIDKALETALKVTDRPCFIAARTTIGWGSPHKANDAEVHGAPLGKDELENTKKNLNWPLEPMFYVPDAVRDIFASRVEKLKSEYEAWNSTFTKWSASEPELAKELTARTTLATPKDLDAKLIAAVPKDGKPIATRKLSSEVIQAASANVPALIGGSADLEPSTFTLIKGSSDINRGSFSGKNIRFGVREHGMGAVMNGMAYYGGFIPYGSTFLCFSDYMRPTLRLAAISHIPGLFVFTHESIFLGEDGPTHQPVEHAQSLRLIQNLYVLRPADGIETAVCYAVALERKDGPCAILLTRQNLDPIERAANFSSDEIRRGGYTVYDTSKGTPDLVMVATGSEVSLAIAAAKLITNASIRVVSMPCYELFKKQDEKYRSTLIPPQAKKVTLEAGVTHGWMEMVGGSPENTLLIGIDRFGASAPFKVLAKEFGFLPDAVAQKIRTRFFG